MPEDMYGDEGPDQASAASSENITQKERDEVTKGKTAVINSEICPGMEPGDTMVLRITAVNDGEYTVEYEPSENPKEGEGEGKEVDMEGGEGEPAMMGGGGGGGGGSMYD